MVRGCHKKHFTVLIFLLLSPSEGLQTTQQCASCLEACSTADLVASLAARVSQLEARIATVEGEKHTCATTSCDAESETATLEALGLHSFHVIHLKRNAERAATLQRQAAEQGLTLKLFEATDGRDPRFRSWIFPSRHPEATCADIVGAMFDSHRRLWELAASTPGHTAVFEDDVILAPDFAVELARRFPGLQATTYDIAFLGTTTTKNASGQDGLRYFLRPDATHLDKAILGAYAYIISQTGANRLLQLHMNAQRHRLFTAVDLFIGHNLEHLSVLMFNTTESLAKEFRETPSPTIRSNRQVGLVIHDGRTESHNANRNAPEGDGELAFMQYAETKMQEHFEAKRFQQALDMSDAALKSMRRHGCWPAANMLQNTGVTLLRLLLTISDNKNASNTLLQAREAFSSALRYFGGNTTEIGRMRGKDFHSWIANTLKTRQKRGLLPISRPNISAAEFNLLDGSRWWPEELLMLEPLRM